MERTRILRLATDSDQAWFFDTDIPGLGARYWRDTSQFDDPWCLTHPSGPYDCRRWRDITQFDLAPGFPDIVVQMCTGTFFGGTCAFYSGVGPINAPQRFTVDSYRVCYNSGPHQCTIETPTWPTN